MQYAPSFFFFTIHSTLIAIRYFFLHDIRYTNYSLWIKIPLRSLGSNQVDLGGISFSASATFINSSIEVGYKEKAIFIPALTLFSNSSKPLIPPTNSILWSIQGSSIPKKCPLFSWLCVLWSIYYMHKQGVP